MEAKAKQVGVGGQLYYINPANGGWFTALGQLNTSEGDAAQRLDMGDHLIEDFHVGGGVMTGANWSTARPSLIPALRTSFTRAGIEWCRCHRAVCMARPYGEPHHSGRACT